MDFSRRRRCVDRPAVRAATGSAPASRRNGARRLGAGSLVAAALAVGVLAAVSAGAEQASAALPAPVTLNGVGGVKPGMSVQEVRQRWGVSMRLGPAINGSCRTAPVVADGMDGYALFRGGRFQGVEFTKGPRTSDGIRIGSTLRELRAIPRAKRLSSRPNEYVPGASVWFLPRASAPAYYLRFDVSPAKRVTAIAFGNEGVFLQEGCA